MKKYLNLLFVSVCLSGLNFGFTRVLDALQEPDSDPRFKSDILLIIAHPDDETAIGSFLAKVIYDLNKKVSIIYTTRGSGGGNTFGREQFRAMAEIREIEGRQATAKFGIQNVWFVDGIDTPGQDVLHSLSRWGHGKVLEQIVRLVRLTRPEVIITWLPHVVAGENHGDHQAAGVIATEAFDMAGDPTIFPAQVTMPREKSDINNLTEGLIPWQPKKLYFYSDASHPIKAHGPSFDMAEISSSKNVPYYRLAAEIHTAYLTQGEVSEIASEAIKSGDFTAYRKWLSNFNLIFGKSVVNCTQDGDIFEGINKTPVDFKPVRGYIPENQDGLTLCLGGVFAFYREFWKSHELEHIAGLVEPEMEVAAGSYVHIPLIISNNTSYSTEVNVTVELPAGWKISSGIGTYNLQPGQTRPVQTFFFAAPDINEKFQDIILKAFSDKHISFTIKFKVSVKEWTLPQ